MFHGVEMPVWALVLLVGFAAVTFASHFLFPSVRWFFRRRAEKVVARLNERLQTPIQPFKLMRRYDMVQRLRYDTEVLRAVAEAAAQEGVPEAVAHEWAERYAREIVPSFSTFAYFGFAIRLARWINGLFYDVRVGRLDPGLAKVERDAAVVFVMNHRSNMDYMLVTVLAADRTALSYAVGEWARVWPLSKLIKALGAYFIRRKSRDALYRKVLARYVRMATDAGVTQAVFPEGGLSLDGRVAPPKMGILKYIIEGHDLSLRDVVFVPVALNYDRVMEDRVLIAAGQAGERKFRASVWTVFGFVLRMAWQKLFGRFRRFGRAAVSFGAPVSMRDWPGSVEELAEGLMARIADEVPVLPVPLAAWALSKGPGDLAVLAARAGDQARVLEGLEALQARELARREAVIWAVVPGQEALVAFYAASVAHLLDGSAPQAALEAVAPDQEAASAEA